MAQLRRIFDCTCLVAGKPLQPCAVCDTGLQTQQGFVYTYLSRIQRCPTESGKVTDCLTLFDGMVLYCHELLSRYPRFRQSIERKMLDIEADDAAPRFYACFARMRHLLGRLQDRADYVR